MHIFAAASGFGRRLIGPSAQRSRSYRSQIYGPTPKIAVCKVVHVKFDAGTAKALTNEIQASATEFRCGDAGGWCTRLVISKGRHPVENAFFSSSRQYGFDDALLSTVQDFVPPLVSSF